ncbi:MAG: ribonuclease R [Oscillospiraceae bacterium]|nr:ribonuclease R [Oscillospiraceae bacterium]
MATIEQKILTAVRSHKKVGLTRREIAGKAGLKKKQRDRFEQALSSLIEQGKLYQRGERILPMDGMSLTPGEVVKVSGTFGFARPDGWEKDVFVPGRYLLGAIPGDKVLLKISDSTRGEELSEGEVIRITDQSNRPFSGVLQVENGVYAVLPDSVIRMPLPIVKGGLNGAKPGDKVSALLAGRGERHSEHTARIVESFGSAQNPAACALAILAGLEIPLEFPPEALEQAAAIASAEGIHPKEISARLDLRGACIFTIDGADSQDLDDAVSLKQDENGWDLGVHIADVSHYVTHKSPLDEEAFNRGTSVYYADQVVPMLPPELSNGICSLNPNEDRLAFSALIRLDKAGNMTGCRFVKTVIRSRVKGVYAELNALTGGEDNPELREKYAEVWDSVVRMRALAEMLISKRKAGGKMVLESTESKILMDEKGQVTEIVARGRGFFEELIEEFMLLANEAAASYADSKDFPFVYRTHEDPSPEKLDTLYELLERLGVRFNRPNATALSAGLAEILTQVEGGPYASIVNVLVLRAMSKAKYTANNTGHFGLRLDNYAHFTSPIRRYPDLCIHRILSSVQSGIKPENLHRRYSPFAVKAAERSTQREIAAVTAERSCVDCYKASYIRKFLGEELEGVVSGVTAHGVFVQLPNTCEGLVRQADFPPGDWSFDGIIAWYSRPDGKRIRLGDAVKIKVLAADVSLGRVDFALV